MMVLAARPERLCLCGDTLCISLCLRDVLQCKGVGEIFSFLLAALALSGAHKLSYS